MATSKYFKGTGRMATGQSPSHEEVGPTGDPPPSLDSLFTDLLK